MKKRLAELCLVVSAVALFIHYQASEPGLVNVTPTPAALIKKVPAQPVSVGDAVPSFTLTDSRGEEVLYRKGVGPVFITLTATGCGDCLHRIKKEDVTAYEMAKESGVAVWNLLVFHPTEGAAGFAEQHRPSADRVMADPSSVVSVKTLGGSDATCWLLIDAEGRLAYRGPVDTAALKSALADL